MIYPSDFEIKTGFDILRKMVSDACLSDLGRAEAAGIGFSSDREVVSNRLIQTDEFRRILLFEEPFPAQDYYDLTPALSKIRIPGTWLDTDRLSELRLSLLAILEILSYLDKRKELFPNLYNLGVEITGSEDVAETCIQIAEEILRVIDERSMVRSGASDELGEIRRNIEKTKARIEKQVLQIFRTARQQGWTPEDSDVTVRDGHLVIPLMSAHKRKVTGFVRDESATGQTVFVEPAELLELNNGVRELELAEHREIIRILTRVADRIRLHLEELGQAYLLLGRIDFIRAKALLAIRTGGTLPSIGNKGAFSWRQAVHPLLYLKHKPLKKPVVPLDLSLDSRQRVLIISGPNAGGKSICLKTTGLLQYMLQCGLLPPMKEGSEMCLFERIFIDIGDEQSLENDLSTYTSKLLNTKYFIENLTPDSLFLIDEMGTGTDPSLGGPIAEASLEAMIATGAFGIVTTHYSNLKLIAGRVPGAVNGAMLFDSKKMKPLYLLKTGSPGSSFAFEIAESIGFPKNVLNSASDKTGKGQLDFDRQLQDLELEKQELGKKATEVGVADTFLSEMIGKYTRMTEELERTRKEILSRAKEEAAELLRDSNRRIEQTIKEIREAQAEKEKTKAVRAGLQEFKKQVLKVADEAEPEEPGKPKKTGQQEEKKSASLTRRLTVLPQLPVSRSPYASYMDDLHQKQAQFRLTLDIRGKRVEEVYPLLQRYIDDAILLSFPEVRILHGKGNGVLRQVTRDYLKSVKEVKKVQDEALELGGAGVTVVLFK